MEKMALSPKETKVSMLLFEDRKRFYEVTLFSVLEILYPGLHSLRYEVSEDGYEMMFFSVYDRDYRDIVFRDWQIEDSKLREDRQGLLQRSLPNFLGYINAIYSQRGLNFIKEAIK